VGLRRGGPADGRGHARGRRGDLAGDVRAGPMARARRLPAAHRAVDAARHLGLRGTRRQASPRGEADVRPPARLLQRRRRSHPGRGAGAHARAARHRRAAGAPLRRLRGVLPAREGEVRDGDRHAAGHRAVSGGPLLAVPVPRGVRRAVGRGGPPRARGGRAARSGDAPARRRHSDAGRARRRADHAGGGRRSAHVRPAARPGEPAAREPCDGAPRVAFDRRGGWLWLRGLAAAVGGRPLLRHRGRSVLAAGAGAALPLRPAAARRRGLALRGAPASGASSRTLSTWCTSGSRAIRACTCTTTARTRRRRSPS